ncbi:ABC transporter permease [Candidatus Sumerlaeota bacterium]|nr:ABC transporter permease [Candidatus Sumerlaeota bacterium]
MRDLLTIFRYELLMQVKSLRFKGMCLIAGLVAFGFYQDALYQQELLPSRAFLNLESLPFYLLAVVFTGLYPMGRIRKTGMHSILMTRPFHAFILALGQMLAALVSLLFPLMIIFFVPGLIIKWQFEAEYPLKPLFHILLFCFIPGICCILSISIWIRACFKNNIAALIILGFIFGATILLANSPLLNVPGQDGWAHNFVPMVSLFSEKYWRKIGEMENQYHISLMQFADWFNFSLSAAYSCLFLLLTCYHLRRTEPQRKVLGTYGRRWYHIPTFLKMACDLKIDPHVGLKSHLILFLLFSVIMAKTGWPMIRPRWQNFLMLREVKSQGNLSSKEDFKPQERYDPNKISEDNLVKINVIRDETIFKDGNLTTKYTFTHDKSASETLAVIYPWGRWAYEMDAIILEGRKVPFVKWNWNYYIEAREFQSLEEGREYNLIIQASLNKSFKAETGKSYQTMIHTRGFEFLDKKKPALHESSVDFLWFDKKKLFPAHIALSVPESLQMVDSPVPPYRSEKEPEKEKWKFWRKETQATYHFDIPAIRNGCNSKIVFLNENEEIVELEDSHIPIRFVVEKRKAKLLREILEGAVPVIEEFCALYRISPSEPVIIWISGSQMDYQLDEIKRIRVRLWRNRWWQDNLFENLNRFMREMSMELFFQTFYGRGPNSRDDFPELVMLLRQNIHKGLNNGIFGIGQFEPFPYAPFNRHQDAKMAMQTAGVTRRDMLNQGMIPLFQMLYLLMGHDAWIDMMTDLREKSQKVILTPELMRESAEKVHGKSLDWFFDYWTKKETGLPSYRIDYARARMRTSDDEEETFYDVEAQFTNVGTGRMPVPVWVETSKGPVTGEAWIGAGETVTWNTTTKALPQTIILDPNGWILTKPAWDEKRRDWILDISIPVDILRTEKKLM